MKTARIILYALFALICLSALFAVFSFAYTGYESISAQSTQTRLGELENKTAQLEAAFKEWRNFPQIFTGFKSQFLMKTAQFAGFRQELITLCSRHGLSYMDLKTEPFSIFSDVIRVRFSMKINGTYHGVKNVLFELSNRPEMAVFKKVSLASGRNPGFVEGSFVMEVYFGK